MEISKKVVHSKNTVANIDVFRPCLITHGSFRVVFDANDHSRVVSLQQWQLKF